MSDQNEYQFQNRNGNWQRHGTSWSRAEGVTHNNYMKTCLRLSEQANQGNSSTIPRARCIDKDGNVLDMLG